MNPCTICPHPRRAEAEAMLAAGASLARAAAAIGVTKPALHRHWTRHGPSAQAKRDDAATPLSETPPDALLHGAVVVISAPFAASASPRSRLAAVLWPGMGRCYCTACGGLRAHAYAAGT